MDTKRENAEEKARIKTLTLGLAIPNFGHDLNKEELTLLITQGGSLVDSLRTDAITLLGEELKGILGE